MRQHAGVFAANFSSNLLWQNCFAPKKCAFCAEPRRAAAGILDVCQGGATTGLRETHLLRRMFSYARRPKGVLFLCTGRRGDVASPPTGDLPHPSVGRSPRAPPRASRIARRDTWVPPYESYCAPFGAEHHRQADVGADDSVRPNSAKRCHSEPVTVSLAWESVPLGPYLLTTSRPSDQTETMLCRCVM